MFWATGWATFSISKAILFAWSGIGRHSGVRSHMCILHSHVHKVHSLIHFIPLFPVTLSGPILSPSTSGIHPWPDSYWPKLNEILRNKGIRWWLSFYSSRKLMFWNYSSAFHWIICNSFFWEYLPLKESWKVYLMSLRIVWLFCWLLFS